MKVFNIILTVKTVNLFLSDKLENIMAQLESPSQVEEKCRYRISLQSLWMLDWVLDLVRFAISLYMVSSFSLCEQSSDH